ncbi:MAG: hypothetical protein P4L90_26040 [Rhodopila sp.]|nr:hypothetical protein [Rhodopila sp.]
MKLMVALLLLIAGPASAQMHISAYDSAAQLESQLDHAVAVYAAAGLAPRCGFRDYPWMFKQQRAIQAGLQKSADAYGTLTDDKAAFRPLATGMVNDAVNQMHGIDWALVNEPIPTGACVRLHNGGVLDMLDRIGPK